jgi:hypothetical protein
MSDSSFRDMFEHLRTLSGRRIEWPQLLRFVIEDELARVRKVGKPYLGKVFRDRDRHAYLNENNKGQHLEVVLVQRLYREVHKRGNGCLQLGDEDVLLISYNVPNQGGHRRRCADLMGLRLDGSLVVFECKGKDNPDSPLVAVLEGLDYLGHLAISANIASLKKDFDVWRKKPRNADVLSKVPEDFGDVTIKPEARHAVIVLAPQDYFSFHMQDAKKKCQDWHLLSDRAWPETVSSASLDFAITDFKSAPCALLTL